MLPLYISTTAGDALNVSVDPIIKILCALAALACTFFLIVAGFEYMSSSGSPEKLMHAKKVVKRALIGLTIVLAAAVITGILSHAYGSNAGAASQNLPSLGNVKPDSASFSLVDVIIKAITGLLNYLIQSIGQPVIKALGYFTSGTPLMVENGTVFKLWLGLVGMTDVLFVLAVCLVGFHIMSSASLGFNEIEIKHLIPRLSFIFLFINSSIFAIDAVIGLSNSMISAVYAGFGNINVWDSLTAIAKQSGSMGLAALIIMMVFLVLAFILLIYYVGRLVTLYLGAVLSPLIILLLLIPSFQDFAVAAIKSYVMTIFVLFVHVIILILAGSILTSLVVNSNSPDPIMSLVVGTSTLISLIKTQGVMSQLNYASIGPKALRRLGGQLVNSINHGLAS